MPLSFKTATAGNYTIGIDHVDGLFTSWQDIILKDYKTGTETDLKANNYSFTAIAGVDNTRFSLKYQKTLSSNTPVFDENIISVYNNNGAIHIKSETKAIENVKLFDISGRLIYEKSGISSNETTIDSSKFTHQVLIVQITSEGKNIINKKVIN